MTEKHISTCALAQVRGAGGQAVAPELLEAVRSAVPEELPRRVDSAAVGTC